MKPLLITLFLLLLMSCKDTHESNLSSPILQLSKTLSDNPDQCSNNTNDLNEIAIASETCNWLSNYNFFDVINSSVITPKMNGLKYELNSALFTDFAKKDRFIFLPKNTAIQFQDQASFTFPLNSVIVKVFSLKQSSEYQIIEIRLLIKRQSGWIFLPYIWLDEKQDAFLYRNGYQLQTDVETQDSKKQTLNYHIPSQANCGECHQVKENNHINFYPIGLKARHLNKIIEHQGLFVNQLDLWQLQGKLIDLPNERSTIDTAPNWRDDSARLQERAKAYLDINCAHCHNDNGSAALSGLRLEYWRKSISHAHGVCNSSHGWRGGGFDIWPGRGEISSIPIRMRHVDAKDRMPPIGRSLVDEEAAQLVSDWIDTLPFESCAE